MKNRNIRFTALKKMQEIKTLLTNEEIADRTTLYKRLKGNSLLYTWLWKNGIIRKDENTNLLYWNGRIPITDHLSLRFVDYVNMYMAKYKAEVEEPVEVAVEEPPFIPEPTKEEPVAEKPKTRRKYTRRKLVEKPVTQEWSREISLFWGLIKFKL